jgi:hypothetical protein
MGARAADYVSRRENWWALDFIPAKPIWEQRTLEALEPYRPMLKKRPEVLAMKWGKELGHGAAHEVCKAVAARLSDPMWAAQVLADGEPIAYDPAHPDFQRAPLTAEERQQYRDMPGPRMI